MAEEVAYFAVGSLFGAGIAIIVMRDFVLKTLDEAMRHRSEAFALLEADALHRTAAAQDQPRIAQHDMNESEQT